MVSIIIPYYNSQEFIADAIKSIFSSSISFFEILIIDDGSIVPPDISFFNLDERKCIKIFKKENGGPASARNFGVKFATGDFLFFLDSDNSIHKDYLKKAYQIMVEDESIGVVYSKANFFSENGIFKDRFETKNFNLDAILAGNYIDMCSMVRKKAFEEIGGFDENNSLIGWEDADLWVRLGQTKWKFKFLNEILFNYRVRDNSLMGMADKQKMNQMLQYFSAKHGFIIHHKYRKYYRVTRKIEERPFTFFLRVLYYKYFLRRPLIK